ncbi:MAG: potassium transporter Kup [Moraxellaceae bacterium]|nr:potassium transporter Kup [Moraxellaceae bacterium]
MSQAHGESQSLRVLTLAALGVVFGDIGTSPLYAMKEAFAQTHFELEVSPENVLGILSMMVWSLLVIVTFKYVIVVLRADNHGEGGVVALMARVVEQSKDRPKKKVLAIALGLFGASLFYGDGVITPAISVLSAVEGLEVATPAFKPYVLPVTIGILTAIFFVQRFGTSSVGRFFGPVVAVWFVALAAVGIYNIAQHPDVLLALSPHYAAIFAWHQPVTAFFAMGAVLLTVTGGEALYADMGHFGKRPIRLAWLCLVLPSLLLNYFGQGALLTYEPEAARNPFFLAVPDWGLYPMVALATAATAIASQALITGAFSVTRELIQLGYCPRMTIRHTSGQHMGQIYLPFVNWSLFVLVIAVVLGFRSSSALAAAYGIAVTMTMLVTTVLAFSVARRDWNWSNPFALTVFGPLLAIELTFFGANTLKIADGGWFPIIFGGTIYFMLSTWRRGRMQLADRMVTDSVPLEPFVRMIEHENIARVPHTAVFLTPRPEQVPNAFLHNLKHNLVVHETVIFLTVNFLPVPRTPDSQRALVERVCHNMYRVKLYFGFMERPDLPAALEWVEEQGLPLDPQAVSYFVSRETLLPAPGEGMPMWRERLFEVMFRNATPASNFFNLPPGRVVELGSQVAI